MIYKYPQLIVLSILRVGLEKMKTDYGPIGRVVPFAD